MKRGLAALIILVLVCTFSLMTSSIIASKAQALTELAEKVYNETEKAETLKEEWTKQSNWFTLFINHNHLEPIASKIEELKYVSDEDRLENCAQIIAELKEIKEHISLSLYNVF